MCEEQFVLQCFEKAFKTKKRYAFVLYGIGKNTKYLLENLDGYNIIGLMDAQNTGKQIYGHFVLSKEQVVGKADIIVIVARVAVQKIIYNRIRDLESKGVSIVNVQGKHIENSSDTNKAFQNDSYWERSYGDLIQKIDKSNVVSFDIFDTLIMRKTLFPRDIYGIIAQFFANQGIECGFENLRYESEIALNEKGSFSFNDIYSQIQKKNPALSDQVLYKMMDKELELECRLAVKRKDIFDAFEYAKSKGKKVFLCSDMYFNKIQMTKILQKCGIYGYDDILISSEIGKTKAEGGIFQELKMLAGVGENILHVGDNVKSDYEKAVENGIEGYLVRSAYEMLLHSSIAHLLSCAVTLEDDLMLGLFLARAFNSPFTLSSTKGYFEIKTREEVGYLCFAPVLCSFMRWFIEQMDSKNNYTKILFSARDGWLVKQMYDKFEESKPCIERKEAIYFLTSRRAVSVAAISDKIDIRVIWDKTNAPLSLYDFFETKYGICVNGGAENKENILKESSYIEELLEKYESRILGNSLQERENYCRYLRKENIDKCDEVILFDLVSSGSIPYYLDKLFHELNLDISIETMCFATANLPNALIKKIEKIDSYWGNDYFYQPQTKIFQYYQLLESVLTAPFPQLKCFDEMGEAIYSDRGYSEDVFQGIRDIQESILSYCEDYIECGIDKMEYVSKKLLDNMFALIESRYSFVSIDVKKAFFFESASENIELHEIWTELVE